MSTPKNPRRRMSASVSKIDYTRKLASPGHVLDALHHEAHGLLGAGDPLDEHAGRRRTHPPGPERHEDKAVHLSLIHISEPTRRTPISYAVFCLKKKKNKT